MLAFAFLACTAHARDDCNPAPANVARLDEIRPGFHKVSGPLAEFDPCHASVRLGMPGFFAKKLADKPPLMIIVHGGGGPGSAELEMARRMNNEGMATLIFDAYELNGFSYKGTMLFVLGVTNESRQRMIYKAALGAYAWSKKQPTIDPSRIYVHGLSNGGSVAVNLAGAVEPEHVRAVFAEGASPNGIGFPDKVNVALKLVYGKLDNYGGKTQEDWMYTRADPCQFNVQYELAPKGIASRCSVWVNPYEMVQTPMQWFEEVKAQGQPVETWFYEQAAHGIMAGNVSKEMRTYGKGPTAMVRYGWVGAPRSVADQFAEDIVKTVKASYP